MAKAKQNAASARERAAAAAAETAAAEARCAELEAAAEKDRVGSAAVRARESLTELAESSRDELAGLQQELERYRESFGPDGCSAFRGHSNSDMLIHPARVTGERHDKLISDQQQAQKARQEQGRRQAEAAATRQDAAVAAVRQCLSVTFR